MIGRGGERILRFRFFGFCVGSGEVEGGDGLATVEGGGMTEVAEWWLGWARGGGRGWWKGGERISSV